MHPRLRLIMILWTTSLCVKRVRGVVSSQVSRGARSFTERVGRRTSLALTEIGFDANDSREEKDACLILHGLLGQSRNFRSWAMGLGPSLESKRRILCLDLRNHGASFHDDTMSFDQMADDVIATLDELGIERCALLGHSLGGKVAMTTAFKAPERIERLCSMDMAPAAYSIADGSNWRSNRQIVEAMYNLDLASLKDRRDADTKLANDVLDPNIRAFALSNLVQDAKTKQLSWKCNISALLANLDAMATWDQQDNTFPGPALFLAGANSRYIRNIHLDAIKHSFPNFALRTVKDAGHWIHAEQPAATQAFAQEFLDTHWPSA